MEASNPNDDVDFSPSQSRLGCALPQSASNQEAVRRHKTRTILCALVLALLSNFCFYASELPLLRLVERKVCDTYYDNLLAGQQVEKRVSLERSCKVPQIQNKVAFVVGCKTAIDAIPRN